MKRDTSRDDWRWSLRLGNRGFSVDQIVRAISAKPSGRREPGSLKYQRLLDERGRDAADRYAVTTAERALRFIAENPAIRDATGAVVRLLELEGAADALPWGLYGGAGPRRALEAMFTIAEDLRTLRFGLALRQWCEIAGQPLDVIPTHRNTLLSLGWITRNPDDRAGRTSRFSLRLPLHIHLHTGGMNVGLGADREWLAHDSFRPEALGDEGWLILRIAATSCSVREIAIRAGFSIEATEDHMAHLASRQLVAVDDEGGVVRTTPLVPALDAAAAYFGTKDRLDDDRAKHRREREAFRARLDVNVEVSA